MISWRRKHRGLKPVRGPETLNMRPKHSDGSTSRYRVVQVVAYTQDAPGVVIWIQNQRMGASVTLDEGETAELVNALGEALRASKATVASRAGQEASQDG